MGNAIPSLCRSQKDVLATCYAAGCLDCTKPKALGLWILDLEGNLTKECGGFVQMVQGGTDSRQRDLGFKPLSKHLSPIECKHVWVPTRASEK